MNAQIRRLAVALIVMIVALMGALTYQQFFFAPTLNAHPLNRRVTDAYWNQERGKIVTGDGALVLAQSLPVGKRAGSHLRPELSPGREIRPYYGILPGGDSRPDDRFGKGR